MSYLGMSMIHILFLKERQESTYSEIDNLLYIYLFTYLPNADACQVGAHCLLLGLLFQN